jgi:hypothetical protein
VASSGNFVFIAFVLSTHLVAAGPRDPYDEAMRLAAADDNDQALTLIEDGLRAAPRDLRLLQLKGILHLKLRDYGAALDAYQRYLDAGARGANRREAQKIVANLQAVKSTVLEIASPHGPTAIYLDSKTQGLYCTTPCKRGMLPGDYKIIAERAGFERWIGRVTVAAGKTATIEVALVERPSQLTIRTTPGDAQITVAGAPFGGSAPVPAGTHEVRITRPGHATAVRRIDAHEGKPVELVVELAPLVPIEVTPPTAELLLDDEPLAVEDGGVAIPPGAHVLVARAPGFHERRIELPASRAASQRLVVTLVERGTRLELSHVPAGSQVLVDGQLVTTTPKSRSIELAPGDHAIEVRAPGYRPYRTTATLPADQPAHLTLDRLVRDSRRRTYLAAGSTGAVVLAATAFSVAALGRESAYSDRARLAGVTAADPELRDMKAAGERYARLADVGFGLALVGAGVTTYFYLREGRGESKGTLRIGVGPGGAVASGRF